MVDLDEAEGEGGVGATWVSGGGHIFWEQKRPKKGLVDRPKSSTGQLTVVDLDE